MDTSGPSPDPLFDYQRTGASFLATRGGGLLFDEQGLGKTPQAIRAADLASAIRIIVVCPAAVKENWRREFLRFSRRPRRVDVVFGKSHAFDPTADVVVINYDLLTDRRVLSALRRHGADTVIFDEAHLLKNPTAGRTRAALGIGCTGRNGLIEGVPRVYALTGTPAPNHVGELWSILRAIAPEAITLVPGGYPLSQGGFTARYCKTVETPFGAKIVGGQNLPELRARLSAFALRRKKLDVLPELPPFRVEVTALSSADAAARIARATAATPGAADLIAALRNAGTDEDAVTTALAQAAPHMTTLRRMTGILKAPLVADLVSADLDGGMDKVVVFAVHRDVVSTLRETFAARGYRPVVIDGSTSAKARQEAIDAFQTDPAVRVFIGNVTAAGTGITLTAASNLVFAELSWVPAENAQAAMRVHRIGQARSVLVRISALPGTVDEVVANTVRRKTRAISQLLD